MYIIDFSKYFLPVLLLFSTITGCSSGGNSGGSGDEILPDPEQIVLSGAGDLGIFDPSVTRDPATGRLWMSYSSVSTSSYYDPSVYWGVAIRLAFSDDDGATWTDAGITVATNVEVIVGPLTEANPDADIPANSQGIWQSETSSLIYDPSAPANERWKLVWHQYLNANLTSFFVDYGWIAMRMADSPMALASATTVKLFGGAGLQADSSLTGSPVFSPVGGAPAIQLNTDLSQAAVGANLTDLNLCIFAEPGLYATTNAVYLAIYCADASTVMSEGKVTEYLEYFRCLSPCNMTNAMSWEYLGRLLTPADAQDATGNHFYQAPAIVEIDSVAYLIVTPVDATTDERYNGCRVYQFTDIDTNQLQRNGGNLLEITRVDGSDGTHNGACAMYPGLAGGILLSETGTFGTQNSFQIFKSQIGIP